jgi:hypothetical protein
LLPFTGMGSNPERIAEIMSSNREGTSPAEDAPWCGFKQRVIALPDI